MNVAELILKLLAAAMFGSGGMLLAFAAWALVQKQRSVRTGGGAGRTSLRRAGDAGAGDGGESPACFVGVCRLSAG